jgi:hypothetical protein
MLRVAMPRSSVDWLGSAEDVGDDAWGITPNRGQFSRAWLAHNQRDMLKSAAYLVIRDGGRPVSLTPFFEVDRDSFRYFAPRPILAGYLREAAAPELADLVERTLDPGALVAQVPAAFASPLRGTPTARIATVAAAAEAEARRRGLSVVALLYLDESDTEAMTALQDCGYRLTALDGSMRIEIDPAWRELGGYFAGQHRASALRRERRRFLDRGYTVEWHATLDDPVIARMAPLAFELHQRKGNPFTEQDIREYYAALPNALVDLSPLVVTANRDGTTEAYALLLRDRDRLWAESVGFGETSAFLYFNILFYEPVAYAITHGLREIDLGLASDAKRHRANRCARMTGAFRFLDDALRDAWGEIAAVLARRYDQLSDTGASR